MLVPPLEAPSPSPDEIKITVPPEPEPGFYHFLDVCTKKVSHECGENIVKSVLENVETTRKCCGELVHGMGKICHDDLLKFFVSLRELGLIASQVYTKGDQIWNNCVKIAASRYD